MRCVRDEASLVIESDAELGVKLANLSRVYHNTPGKPKHGKQEGEGDGRM